MPEGRGLEFGAAANPTRLSSGHRVEYVDHIGNSVTDAPGSVHVDYVWRGTGSLAEICGQDQRFDFAIAAQVAQYVPDLLGWFRGIFDVLRVGGVLNLSLADRRFMLDIRRRTSSLGEALEAFQFQFDRPNFRQLFDHLYDAAAVSPEGIWSGREIADTAPRLAGDSALAFAYAQARGTISSGNYVTCHCWVFTPLSFLDLLADASRLEVFPFIINQFASTEPHSFEFFVSMRRDSEEDPVRLKEKQLGAIAHVRAMAERQSRIARLLAEG